MLQRIHNSKLPLPHLYSIQKVKKQTAPKIAQVKMKWASQIQALNIKRQLQLETKAPRMLLQTHKHQMAKLK